jgi:CBS domain-containing protein
MMTVKEIMKCDVVSVPYGVPVVQAAKMMRQRKIGSVFVTEADLMERHATRHLAVTKSGEFVGVVSVRDLLHPVSIDEF